MRLPRHARHVAHTSDTPRARNECDRISIYVKGGAWVEDGRVGQSRWPRSAVCRASLASAAAPAPAFPLLSPSFAPPRRVCRPPRLARLALGGMEMEGRFESQGPSGSVQVSMFAGQA